MTQQQTVFLSIPGLRAKDIAHMPNLAQLMSGGEARPLTASFPCVTWPSQTAMLTGKTPREHGVVANGFYWRDTREVEMWTAWNEKINSPQIWDLLHERDPKLTSAVWFPMLSKGSGADFICMPAPVHNPDGSESLWCYTRPTEYYGELLEKLDHFPLKHFWGPLANIKSTAWIIDSAVLAAHEFSPRFFHIYLPHLDYAAQKTGPDSEQAINALGELDQALSRLVDGFESALGADNLLWLAASEYVITNVDHVSYPNRLLRDEGLLVTREEDDGEHLDLEKSRAWAMVDHQFSHVFVADSESSTVQRVADLFRGVDGIAEVLAGEERAKYAMDHERSGEVILISAPNSWQAYYWWLDDDRAPGYARTVDIHRKPGYDPVELHFDMATKSIPLDATLIRGSHGAPVLTDEQRGVFLSSRGDVTDRSRLTDTDLCDLVLRQFTGSGR